MPVKNPSHLDDALKSINYCQCSLSYNNKNYITLMQCILVHTYVCMLACTCGCVRLSLAL